nr:hypothetical protein [Bradyrhizobium yuanmingense]
MLYCDRNLEVLIAALGKRQTKPARKLSRPRVKTKQVNTPAFDVRTALYGVLGVDLTEIHGLAPSLALKLIGECGTDLRAWQTASTSPPGFASHRATRSPAASAVFAYATILQSGSRAVAVGGHNGRSK